MATSADKRITRIDNAAVDISTYLSKTFTMLPESMKRKYELGDNDMLIALALGMLWGATTTLAAATGSPIDYAAELQAELRAVAVAWLLKQQEKPASGRQLV